MQTVNLKQVVNAALRQSFSCFFEKVFYTLNPGKEYQHNWHISYLTSLLDEVEQGKHKNLIICIPPRSLKSTLISVAWSAWMMGKYPNMRIMAASYSQSLSTKHSIDTRNIISSSWFSQIFPRFKLAKDQNRKTKFASTEHGFRMATSVGGTTIGEGGDILIVDDPLSPLQANSKTYRNRAINWFKESFSTRLDDKKNGIKIIIMQRLHEDDLCGKLIKEMPEDWKIVNIPAIATETCEYNTEKFSYKRSRDEILHNSREGINELELMERQLGSRSFSAQYQQQPVPLDGAVIKNSWIKRYRKLPNDSEFIVQSWDLAFTKKSHSDYSVCTTWLVSNNNYFLADVYRVQKEFPELINDSEYIYNKWQAKFMLVEDTVASKAFIQELRKKTQLRVISQVPLKDKYTRLAITSPSFEAGKIYLPHDAKWLADFEYEIFNFPQTAHDDQIDSTTQFLNYIEKAITKAGQNFIGRL